MMEERQKSHDTLNITTPFLVDVSTQSVKKTLKISDRNIWLIYLITTGVSSVLAILRGYRDITTSVIDIDFVLLFVMPDMEPLVLSYIASSAIVIINLLSFFGAIFIFYGLNHTKKNYVYIGIQISRIFYSLLVVFLSIGIIVIFLGSAGPFFLMPFALIPMIVFGLIFAMMKHTLLRFNCFIGNLDSFMRANIQRCHEVRFIKSVRLTTKLLVCSGVSMIIVSIMLNLFVDEETIGKIFEIFFKIYPFSMTAYLYSVISILYIYMVSKKIEDQTENDVMI